MNHKPIQMGKISYINASPVFYGLDNGLLPDWLEMVADVPSVLNRKIIEGRIQISPISAAFYAMNHKALLLLPDLSISCHGRVMSVLLASRYALDDLDGKTILLSRESASAASFLKMIFHQRKIAPFFRTGDVGHIESVLKTADAILVIGDTALIHPWHQIFEHCMDLGELWHEMTHLPFVFAVWAVRRSFAADHPLVVKKIHDLLLASKALGYKHPEEIVDAAQKKIHIEKSRLREYFALLFCDLNPEKTTAMGLFFDSLFDQKILAEKAGIQFFNP